jgi:ABC-2 type transport system ATP-binding protein
MTSKKIKNHKKQPDPNMEIVEKNLVSEEILVNSTITEESLEDLEILDSPKMNTNTEVIEDYNDNENEEITLVEKKENPSKIEPDDADWGSIEEELKLEMKSKTLIDKYDQKVNLKQIRPIIQVKNLVKSYGDFVAVNNISFEVKRGEIFGILGPNGAGKTTTLEIIETILSKTSGSILIDGLDIDVYSEQIKNMIGVQLQTSGFYPKLNLKESLEMFASIYNVESKAMELLEKVGLKDKAKDEVNKLSGGQQQRFSIAVTLVADPEIIFLDEPTTGLDPQARRNLWDLILDLKKQGKTIVITTHYMDEAEKLCDKIAIMDSGKILEINTTNGFINELLERGFKRPELRLAANLEDVFLDITGKSWRD